MDLILVTQAVVLGVIQGLTEFLPISSSAHLILVPWLFNWNDPVLDSLPFDVALHIGTLIAVLAYFARDWVRLIRAGIRSIVERKIGGDPDRRLAWLLVLGSIPGAVVGALAESKVEEVFHHPAEPVSQGAVIAVAAILALMGLALFIAERVARHVRTISELGLRDALIIGIAQAAAVFPGVSRSGSTITAGLALGLARESAARFSFLLGAPIIAGAGIKSLLSAIGQVQSGQIPSGELGLFPIGFFAAAISGFVTIGFLLRYLHRNSTDLFVYYRWIVAAVFIVIALVRG